MLTTKAFDNGQIRKPKIVFSPDSRLQDTRTLATFERVGDKKEEEAEGGGSNPDENPDIL